MSPLVLEINTRCWLHDLSDKCGRPLNLASVPDAEFLGWKASGLTQIWLMGVWSAGPKTRDIARATPELRSLSDEAFGANDFENIVSSPFAIADYEVSRTIGGPIALRHFRNRLRHHGIGLILDFIPNHLGLDHPWIQTTPELFVHSPVEKPETFSVARPGGTVWVAHGKDPYFAAWGDTAQLDYRNPATRTAMLQALKTVAYQCDGVRCDMAMLVLNEVFAKTWSSFPTTTPAPRGEFWGEAIASVKQSLPGFLFVAEAYWNLEPSLQSLGFDYVYDKTFYDLVLGRDSDGLQAHARAQAGFNPVRFLENHDEPRIASLMSVPEHEAAALFLLKQPGMRLLHDGQLVGRRKKLPVQFSHYCPEPPDPEITDFYRALLSAERRDSFAAPLRTQ